MTPTQALATFLRIDRAGAKIVFAGLGVFAAAQLVIVAWGLDIRSGALAGLYVVLFGLLLLVFRHIISDRTLRAVVSWAVVLLAIACAVALFLSDLLQDYHVLPPPRCLIYFWSTCDWSTTSAAARLPNNWLDGLLRLFLIALCWVALPSAAISYGGKYLQGTVPRTEKTGSIAYGIGALGCASLLFIHLKHTPYSFLSTSEIGLPTSIVIASSLFTLALTFFVFLLFSFVRRMADENKKHDEIINRLSQGHRQ